MRVDVENLSPVEKKVTVEIDPGRVVKELDKAYAGLGRRVKLRGFRPGRAPRQVLERNFKDDVEREVTETLVREAFAEAVRENEIAAVAPPQVDLEGQGIDASQPFRFSARVEVKPRLEPKDYRGLEVEHRTANVTDEMVSEELTKLQDSMAQLVPVEGRFEAQEGDYATVDHQTFVDGQPYPKGSGEGVTMRVGAGDLFQGFVPQLAGAKLGDTVVVEQPFPADFHDEALRGKAARFEMRLQGLKTRQPPSLDDAMAKDVGLEGVETLDQLRARIREELEGREKRRAESELKDALVKAALAKNEFEVPPALVERAIDAMLQGALERFARQGIDVRKLGLDLSRLRADMREQALLQVKGALLLEAIADAEKIEVADEDYDKEVERMAAEMNVPAAKLARQASSPDGRHALRTRLREDRALALMTSEARLKETGPA
jgi:trigger factor